MVICLSKLTQLDFWDTSQVVSLSVGWFNLSSFIEILNSFFMIFYVLIYNTSAFIDQPIVPDRI